MSQFIKKGKIINRIPFRLWILTTNIGMNPSQFFCDFGVRYRERLPGFLSFDAGNACGGIEGESDSFKFSKGG